MQFISTRGSGRHYSFQEALLRGLAPDGGLFHPVQPADLSGLFRSLKESTGFAEMAAEVTHALFPDEFDRKTAEKLCTQAFPFSPELRPVDDSITILELFHGPSCAFKDFGASYLATCMEHFLAGSSRRAIILTATSGDTGSAVARAFHNKENIDVVILYPSGRVSPLQEKQLTTVGDNVTALEVEGSFDDCQRMVKEAFVDEKLMKELPLTSANSINLGRLIPQSFYYMYSWLQTRGSGDIYFCVPSGNFGNLTAGILASEWGLPVRKFIAATNANDVVPEYLRTSRFSPRPSVQTLSNAMDVGNPSNFERMLAIFDNDAEKMRNRIHEEVVTDEETMETMARFYEETGLFIDPHTAVGYLASSRFTEKEKIGDGTILTLSTAHPGKFLEVVEEATGKTPLLPEQLAKAMELPKVSVPVKNTLEALSSFLMDSFG